MIRPPLIRRSIRHYWRANLAVLAATAVAGTVLAGALLVGGSVRRSLDQLVFLRLGQTRTAVVATDLLPRADLAARLRRRLGTPAAAVLAVPGVVSVPGSERRAGQVQVCGVDADFPALAPFGQAPVPERGTVVLAAELARHLAVGPGDEVVIRLERLSGMPKDTPLAQAEDAIVPLRLAVADVVGNDRWARFGLQADHAAPRNAFVNRDQLAEILEIPGRANLFLATGGNTELPLELPSLLTGADASLELRELPGGGWEVRSPRVFLANGIVKELARRPRRPAGILTYLANRIEKDGSATPYSFVAGTDADWLPEMDDDGIVLNQWLADDLQARVGDLVRLRYYTLGPLRELVEEEAPFTVRHIVPLDGPFADPGLMPDFPGIADAEDCTDWDTGVNLDFSRIRPKDEAYWDTHRGTPKAFVTLARAQQLWGNRFGSLTAVRFRERDREQVELALATAANPFSLGCSVQMVWTNGLAASRNSVDFSGLFLGLSFFLILAALLLTALLYSLGLETRRGQIATLRALGWPARQVHRLFLRETLCLALPGVLLGAAGGLLYNRLVIHALATVWKGSVGQAPLAAHVSWPALLLGLLASLLVALLALRFPLRQATSGAPLAVLAAPLGKDRSRLGFWLGAALVLAGLVLVLLTPAGRGKDAAATFFGAGSLILVGALAVDAARRRRLGGHRFDRTALARRGTARRPGRSLAVESILAAAVFLTVAVGANRHGSQYRAEERQSGTGGFAFFGETAMPVFENLNGEDGRDHYGLDGPELDDLRLVQFSLLPGDEASCLNLNRPQQPRLLGVDPAELDRRQAFRFAKLTPEVDPEHPWLVLDRNLPDQSIPAIADETVIVWALNRRVGETFTVRSEDGRPVRLRLVAGLANSVLQGNLVIGRDAFQDLFPSISGTRVLLVDAPPASRAETGDLLRVALRDRGLELTPASERLAQFATVENTYLAIFLALGGLALLLGGVGLGLVLVRNVLDRRAELALFRAVGFRRRELAAMLFAEHAWLFLRGLAIGTLAGLAAVLPVLATPGGNPALGELTVVLLLVVANGLLWIWIAARRALRAPLVPALRDE